MLKLKIIFLALGLDIDRKYKAFSLKGLEISYLPIFLSARLDNINSVKKKIKKNMDISKIILFVSGFRYRSEVGSFSGRP